MSSGKGTDGGDILIEDTPRRPRDCRVESPSVVVLEEGCETAGRRADTTAACRPLDALGQFLDRAGPERRWDLTDRHELGGLVKAVYNEATALGATRYGARLFDSLRDRFGLSPDLFRKAMRFHDAFSAEQAQALSARRLGNGQPFSWSHVRRLLEVQDASTRAERIALTVASSWTSEQLAKAIQASKGGKRNRGGRRRSPEGARALLEELLSRPGVAEVALGVLAAKASSSPQAQP